MFSWFPLREEQAITEGGHPGSAAQDFCGQGRSDSPSDLPCLFLTAGDCMGKLLCRRGDQKGQCGGCSACQLTWFVTGLGRTATLPR